MMNQMKRNYGSFPDDYDLEWRNLEAVLQMYDKLGLSAGHRDDIRGMMFRGDEYWFTLFTYPWISTLTTFYPASYFK